MSAGNSSGICNHGFFEWRCGICSHLPGECDYGSCHAPAAMVAEYVHADRIIERRPMCAHHAHVSAVFANSGSIAGCKVVAA